MTETRGGSPSATLSESEARTWVETLERDNRAFYGSDRGRGALTDLHRLFLQPWHYFAELLQNALDSRATEVRA